MHSTIIWYIVTFSMPLCFLTALSCVILQYKSFLYAYDQQTSRSLSTSHKQVLLLYAVYGISGFCALQCFLCHISNEFPIWYCKYGMAICVIFYAAAKTCLYGFLLERAILAQPTGEPLLPLILMKRILPIYLFCYFLMYLIACPISFRGKLVYPADIYAISACEFSQYIPLIFQISSFLDFIHSAGFVYLFLAPMFMSIRQSISSSSTFIVWDKPSILAFLSSVNINVLCTVICCITSMTVMWIMSYGDSFEYIWLAGNIDMAINCVTTFNTLAPNRHYVSKFCCFGCFGINCSKFMECRLCCSCLIDLVIPPQNDDDDNNINNDINIIINDDEPDLEMVNPSSYDNKL